MSFPKTGVTPLPSLAHKQCHGHLGLPFWVIRGLVRAGPPSPDISVWRMSLPPLTPRASIHVSTSLYVARTGNERAKCGG